MILLTESGVKKVNRYITKLEAKRKEILDAGIDTADDTELPDCDEVFDDISWFEEGGEYLNGWGVTDNYDSDYALNLLRGVDYVGTGVDA